MRRTYASYLYFPDTLQQLHPSSLKILTIGIHININTDGTTAPYLSSLLLLLLDNEKGGTAIGPSNGDAGRDARVISSRSLSYSDIPPKHLVYVYSLFFLLSSLFFSFSTPHWLIHSFSLEPTPLSTADLPARACNGPNIL